MMKQCSVKRRSNKRFISSLHEFRLVALAPLVSPPLFARFGFLLGVVETGALGRSFVCLLPTLLLTYILYEFSYVTCKSKCSVNMPLQDDVWDDDSGITDTQYDRDVAAREWNKLQDVHGMVRRRIVGS